MEDIVERLRAITGQAGDHGDVQLCDSAADEIERLREAIRRLADQDATLSVCDGEVTVTMEGPLTGDERDAVDYVCRNVLPDGSREGDDALHLLRMLLKRTQ